MLIGGPLWRKRLVPRGGIIPHPASQQFYMQNNVVDKNKSFMPTGVEKARSGIRVDLSVGLSS